MSGYNTGLRGYSESGMCVTTYYNRKEMFRPGSKVKIRVASNPKLVKVSYCWDNGERIPAKIFLNHCCFKAKVPNVDEESAVLKTITEIQREDGKVVEREFTSVIRIYK